MPIRFFFPSSFPDSQRTHCLDGKSLRDREPANIMIVPDPAGPGGERVKVLDFGIAKLASSAAHTKTGQIMGTVSHMSPEQIRTPAQVNGQSDVYSLATVLYFLLAGRPPFTARNADLLVLTMHLSYAPEPIDQLVPELSPQLARLIMCMLNKAPSDRPTMAQVSEELLALDPAASSQALRRPSRAALVAIKPRPPDAAAPRISDSLTVSTLAQGAGQVASRRTVWRRALPAFCVLTLIVGAVVTVSIVREPAPNPKSLAAPQTTRPRRPPPTPTPPPSTEPTEHTAVDKSAAAPKLVRKKPQKLGALGAQTPALDKPRKKNAPPPAKTTPDLSCRRETAPLLSPGPSLPSVPADKIRHFI